MSIYNECLYFSCLLYVLAKLFKKEAKFHLKPQQHVLGHKKA